VHHIKTPPDLADVEAAIDLGLKRSQRTDLGRLVLAARREFFSAEGRFLDGDELDREVAVRRGGETAASED
jgi:hypothetical protein